MTTEQLVEEMTQYEDDLDWVIENYDELIKDYAETHIAVLNGRVIGYAPRIEDLQEMLQHDYADDMNHILVDFIYKEHPNFVL